MAEPQGEPWTRYQSRADHPYSDPGDGRTECPTCGKWVHLVIHSCKRIPVTEAAWRRRCGSATPGDGEVRGG